MYAETIRRSWMSGLSLALVLVLVLAFAACGDEEDEDAGVAGDAEVETTEVVDTEATEEATEEAAVEEETEVVTEEATEEVATDATVDTEAVETEVAGADTAAATGLATCLQENLDAEVVTDLRAGETETADAAFRGCIEEELSPALAAQADPIIDQAVACAQQVSEDLTEEEVAAIEEGEEQQLNAFTNETLTCVSEELGVELS